MSVKATVILRILARVAKYIYRKVVGRSSIFVLALLLPALADARPFERLFNRLDRVNDCVVRVCPGIDVTVDRCSVVCDVPGAEVAVSCDAGVDVVQEPTPADPLPETGAPPAPDPEEHSILVTGAEEPAEGCILRRRDRNVNVNVNTRPDLDLDEEAVEPDYVEPEDDGGSILGHVGGIVLVLLVGLAVGVYSLVVAYNGEHNS